MRGEGNAKAQSDGVITVRVDKEEGVEEAEATHHPDDADGEFDAPRKDERGIHADEENGTKEVEQVPENVSAHLHHGRHTCDHEKAKRNKEENSGFKAWKLQI